MEFHQILITINVSNCHPASHQREISSLRNAIKVSNRTKFTKILSLLLPDQLPFCYKTPIYNFLSRIAQKILTQFFSRTRLLSVAGFNSCPQFEGEIPKISPLPGSSIVGTLFYFKTVGLVSIKTIREASRNIYNWTIVYLIIILGYHHVRKWLSRSRHW